MEVNLKPVRRRLKAAGVKQCEIASSLGISESTISRVLHGRIPLTAPVMHAVRAALQSKARPGAQVTLDELFPLETAA